MYNIIDRYVNNSNKNGLLLLETPTGSGKTYSVVDYMTDAVINGEERKFFFITTLKKNIPRDDLENMFKKKGRPELYREKVLFVDANTESVLSGFSNKVELKIPDEIRKTEEYRRLNNYAKSINNLRAHKNYDEINILNSSEDTMRIDIEPKFRNKIQGMLANDYKNSKDRIYAIKTDKKWQWLAEMYPSVFMSEKQIILMTVDKFLSTNSTLVEPGTMLYNSNIINNAIIFIDEFDSTKDTILRNIIKTGLRDRIDYIELFQAIYAALHTHEFPAVLTTPSKKRLEGDHKDQSLQSIIDGVIEKADAIRDTYSLQFSHKTDEINDENKNNFLFQDHQFYTILNGNKSYITTKTDIQNHINTIGFSEDRPKSNDANIQTMLGELRGFISWFAGSVKILAINYQQCKNDRGKSSEDEFTYEAAIRTVLNQFGLKKDYMDYLSSLVLMSNSKDKNRIQGNRFDLSFYEKGFRYYAFEDDNRHDMQSKIMMYNFQVTPEKFLLKFCEKAKVIGISATATIPSAIGNYDIGYIREKLQDKYIDTTAEERVRLRSEFEESTKGYDKVNIHTELLGCKEYKPESWQLVFDNNKELAEHVFNELERTLSSDSSCYKKKRYLKMALAFKRFVQSDDIMSFLCVMNKHPKEGDPDLDLGVIKKIFENIVKYCNNAISVDQCLVQLTGEEYDDKKKDLEKRLSQGEKLFVISVYQTIGTGQNLKYPAPESLVKNLVSTNRYERGDNYEKDFDAIYLDRPTNSIVNLTDNISEEDFVKRLFQLEMLLNSGEISVSESKKQVKCAFKTFTNQHRVKGGQSSLKNRNSVILLETRQIIQAIGRICRTNLKSKNIYIFADIEIGDSIDKSVLQGRLFNKEFLELVKLIEKPVKVSKSVQQFEDIASLASIKVNKDINNMLSKNWTDDRVEKWKALRNMVLKHPTLSKEDFDENGIAYSYYMELPSEGNMAFYKEDEDFNNVEVCFERKDVSQKVLSADSSKLTELMKHPGLKKYFESKGWATEFVPGKYIMTPPLFNNIYRGALGEAVGEYLFNSTLPGTVLEEIKDNELFELFDYKVSGCSIYVDFKNWHESSEFDSEKMIKKILDKAKKCDAGCIMIANVLGSEEYKIRTINEQNVKIVIIPAMLVYKNKLLQMNPEAHSIIMECLSEYGI